MVYDINTFFKNILINRPIHVGWSDFRFTYPCITVKAEGGVGPWLQNNYGQVKESCSLYDFS